MMTTTTWWFAINDEESDFCGEEFFVEVEEERDKAKAAATKVAQEIFPNTKITCYGRVSHTEAEMMGLDTY